LEHLAFGDATLLNHLSGSGIESEDFMAKRKDWHAPVKALLKA
jgi:hypothetical protein